MFPAMLLSLGLIVAHTVALHYIFVWVARLLPPRPKVDISHLPEAERKRRGRSFDQLTAVPMFLLWPLVSAGWLLAFQALANWLPNNRPGIEFVVYSNPFYRWCMDIFAGMFVAMALGLLALRLVFGRKYYEWMACRDSVFPIDVRVFAYWCVVWVVPLFIEWDYHWASTYTVFTGEEIAIKEVWSLGEEHYAYNRVKSIEAVNGWKPNPEHELLPTAGVRITFDDGRTWTNAEPGLWFAPDDMAAIEYASKKSGQPIQKVARL